MLADNFTPHHSSMHPLQIGVCDFKPPDHADDPPLFEIVHDRQGHEIVLDKQFLGSVEFVVGLERHYVPRIRSSANTKGLRDSDWAATWTSSRLTTPNNRWSASTTGRTEYGHTSEPVENGSQ